MVSKQKSFPLRLSLSHSVFALRFSAFGQLMQNQIIQWENKNPD